MLSQLISAQPIQGTISVTPKVLFAVCLPFQTPEVELGVDSSRAMGFVQPVFPDWRRESADGPEGDREPGC